MAEIEKNQRSEPPESFKILMTRYFQITSQKKDDPTYSILRAHLAFEEMLRDYIDRKVKHPSALKGSRLNFSQILSISMALSQNIEPTSWHWTALNKLNKVRNSLSHEIEPLSISNEVEKLINFIYDSVEKQNPNSKENAKSLREKPYQTQIDTALGVVYASIFVKLLEL